MKTFSGAALAAALLVSLTACAGGTEETCSRLQELNLGEVTDTGTEQTRRVGSELLELAENGHPDLSDDLRTVGEVMLMPAEKVEAADYQVALNYLESLQNLADACEL